MNTKMILLVVGLVVGGLLGWLTAPTTDIIKVGPLSVEVTQGKGEGGSVTATGNDGKVTVQVGQPSPLDDPGFRTAIFAGVFAVVGLGIGALIEMRRK